MCTRYAEAQCCICNRQLGQSNNRLIVEICGHKKCRECFINEVDGCSLCGQKQQRGSNEEHNCEGSLLAPSCESKSDGEAEKSNETIANDTNDDADAAHIIMTNENGDSIRYKCTICQKSFKSRNNRRYHLFCDKTRSKPFQCSQCDKQFITLAYMNYHESTHNTDKQFSCVHCQKVYSGEVALKKHMRKHQNEFRYQCSQCDEKFLYKEQLNIHQNRHNNVFHKCPECGKRFLIKSNLTKHIQSHTGVNRKNCPICKHSFSGNSALKTHMLTHSKTKPHQCEKCNKKFIDQRTLERHWKTHSDTSFYECTLCSAKSTRKDNIRRHVRNLHSDSDEELRVILEKIFDNFAKKKIESIRVREEKTESANKSREPTASNSIGNVVVNTVEDPSTSVVRNNATSVIKFVGRPQEVQVVQRPTRTVQTQTVRDKSNNNIYVETDANSANERGQLDIAEIGVNLSSLEPLNFDSFPDIAPLPLLNTNHNLTVYRQLLSPYLKKAAGASDDNSNSAPTESRECLNAKSKPSTTPMVIDRPPKKMIEKYEIYRK